MKLLELLNAPGHAIIGLGEEPCYANNHELLNGKDVLSIYLRHQLIPIDWLLIKAKDLLASKSDAEMKESLFIF
jgi:shikimate kinase